MTTTDPHRPAFSSHPRWRLSAGARTTIHDLGLSESEVFAVLDQPQLCFPAGNPGEQRVNGYGLTMVVKGDDVLVVGIDGATREDQDEWAYERALFGDAKAIPGYQPPKQKVAPKEVVDDGSTPWGRWQSDGYGPRRKRKRKVTVEPPVATTHVLDRVHPALRATIRAQVDGDFSRLRVISPTNVEILPPRKGA